MSRWHNYYADDHPHFCTSTIADWKPLLVGDAVNILFDWWENPKCSSCARFGLSGDD